MEIESDHKYKGERRNFTRWKMAWMAESAAAVAGWGVIFNLYFYRSEQRDEGLNSDEDCDGVSVGGAFWPFAVKWGIERSLQYRLELLKCPSSVWARLCHILQEVEDVKGCPMKLEVGEQRGSSRGREDRGREPNVMC
jgi:hypothetical protein